MFIHSWGVSLGEFSLLSTNLFLAAASSVKRSHHGKHPGTAGFAPHVHYCCEDSDSDDGPVPGMLPGMNLALQESRRNTGLDSCKLAKRVESR